MSYIFTPAPQKWQDESLQSLSMIMTQRQPNDSHLKPTPVAKFIREFVHYFKSPVPQRKLPALIKTEFHNEPIHKHAPLDIYYPSKPDLSGSQCLVHRDAAEVEPIDGTFVDDVVRTFKGQRIQGYQFAVLVLSPECQVTLRHMPAYAMTNSSSPTHPPDHTLQNYIVARPDGDHTEVLLLQRFPTLLARNTPGCKSILLYSWFLPCLRCAEEIARVLGQYTTTHRVTVVYTSTLTKNEDKDREYIGVMEAAGIALRKGEHKKRVPRIT